MPKKKEKVSEEKKARAEGFGERIGKQAEDFAEEMEGIGERIRERFGDNDDWKEWKRERKERMRERSFRMHWKHPGPLGFIWPLIGSIFGLVMLVFGIILLNFVNIAAGSSFISAVSRFLIVNLAWLFLAMLFFGYADYFLRLLGKARWLFSPIVSSLGISFAAWILAALLNAVNVSAKSAFIARAADFLAANLFGIFIVFLVLGYVVAIVMLVFRLAFWGCCEDG